MNNCLACETPIRGDKFSKSQSTKSEIEKKKSMTHFHMHLLLEA